VGIEKIHIEKFLELAKQNPVLDVRSPGEYDHAHFPGAYNLPLFSDEERKIVGTAYKQESRETAIKIGLDFFGPKMKKMVEEVETIVHSREPGVENTGSKRMDRGSVLIYCWRGGMRSAGVAWLMDLYGFKVYTLVGGYKKFRNYALDTFKLPFQINILGGYTGSGKTEMLKALEKHGERVIDLEEIAKHKGSAFGNIGLPKQPGQEMFENLLALKLYKVIVNELSGKDSLYSPFTTSHSRLWLEDESQRIGDVNIPHELWNTMRQSPVYFMDIPFTERLNRITKEYGDLDKEKLLDCITRIGKRLGSLETKNAIQFLSEGNITECFRVLLKYYDKWYFKSLHNRENINSLLSSISFENAGPQNVKTLLQQSRPYENPVP
jgi:tRNA 2-selenouridine synthase